LLIGIQPEKVETGLTLSKTLQGRFENYIQTILGKLAEFGVESAQTNRKGV